MSGCTPAASQSDEGAALPRPARSAYLAVGSPKSRRRRSYFARGLSGCCTFRIAVPLRISRRASWLPKGPVRALAGSVSTTRRRRRAYLLRSSWRLCCTLDPEPKKPRSIHSDPGCRSYRRELPSRVESPLFSPSRIIPRRACFDERPVYHSALPRILTRAPLARRSTTRERRVPTSVAVRHLGINPVSCRNYFKNASRRQGEMEEFLITLSGMLKKPPAMVVASVKYSVANPALWFCVYPNYSRIFPRNYTAAGKMGYRAR